MAMVDYGALLRINGKLLNKNADQFMPMQKMCGFTLDKAYLENNEYKPISGNYFVYAGDEELLLCFYKYGYVIIKNGNIMHSGHMRNWVFDRETFTIDNVTFTLSILDNTIWKSYFGTDFDEDDRLYYYEMYGKRFGQIKINRRFKHRKRNYENCKGSQKYLMNWSHNGKNYEVIFGYGIEPNKDVYDDIKHEYFGYTAKDIEVIDSWFS